MNQTLIKDINIWTMDERDSRFFGWVLLENGKIASMGEGEPPAMPVQIDGDVVYGEARPAEGIRTTAGTRPTLLLLLVDGAQLLEELPEGIGHFGAQCGVMLAHSALQSHPPGGYRPDPDTTSDGQDPDFLKLLPRREPVDMDFHLYLI